MNFIHFFNSYPSIFKFRCIREGTLMLRGGMGICFSFSSLCSILQCLSPQTILEQWWQTQQSEPVGPFSLKEENLPLQTKELWSENNGRSPSYLPYSLPFSQPLLPTTFFSPAPLTRMWLESRKVGSWAGCLKAGGLSDLRAVNNGIWRNQNVPER